MQRFSGTSNTSGARRAAGLCVALLLAGGLGGSGCAPADGGPQDGADGSGAQQAGVVGSVSDLSGSPLSGVQVACGAAAVATGGDGRFQLALEPGQDRIVVFSREGYVTASRRVSIYADTTSYLPVTLVAQSPAQGLDASAGGSVTGARGAAMTAPPGAFADGAGQPVAGTVEVRLTPYDPGVPGELEAYPGELRGLTLGGLTQPLFTFGVLDVTVTQNGQPVQIASGQTITIEVPAPTGGPRPDSAPVWIFDPQTCLWVQSSHGDAVYDAATDRYVASIGHLSPCNIDRPIVPTCIRGLVRDANGDPVPGAFVQAVPASAGMTSSDFTDLDGYFCLYVERNADLEITVRTRLTDDCPAEMRADPYCVTTRAFTSGSSLADEGYPAACSAACAQVPIITTGTVDPGPADEAACVVASGLLDPFMGTCASGLSGFYECYAPAGRCTSEIDPFDPLGGGMVVEFENGSRMESEFSLFEGVVVKVYGPDDRGNPLCGTYGADEDGTTITTASGQTYTFRVTASGGMEVECPGGFSFALEPEQLELVTGCSASTGGDGSGAACEPRPGTFGAACTFDSDCTGQGQACCGPAFGEKTCQIEVLCDLLCENDWECTGTDICCSAGQYRMCLPASACQ